MLREDWGEQVMIFVSGVPNITHGLLSPGTLSISIAVQ